VGCAGGSSLFFFSLSVLSFFFFFFFFFWGGGGRGRGGEKREKGELQGQFIGIRHKHSVYCGWFLTGMELLVSGQ